MTGSKCLLFACLIFLCCGTACTHRNRQQKEDRIYKDSLSAADGSRALGNFHFGMSQESFKLEKRRFLSEYGNKLYGQDLQTIDAMFNSAGQLWNITFISPKERGMANEEHPYYEFARKKFGLETMPDTWQVGQRKITLAVENRSMDRDWFLESTFKERLNFGTAGLHPSNTYDILETFDFYVMSIRNDSLEVTALKEIETEKQRRFKQEELEWQEKEREKETSRQEQFKEL